MRFFLVGITLLTVPRSKEKPAPACQRGFPNIRCRSLGSAGLGYSAFKCVRGRVLQVLESSLRLFDQDSKCLRLMDRQIGQNLAVDLDVCLVQAIDEASVGQAVLTRSGVDALDPERTEVALAILAVAVSILQRLLDCLLGDADGVLAAAVETLSCAQNLLVLCVGGNASLRVPCHDLLKTTDPTGLDAAAVRQEILRNLLGIRLCENHGAARIANELVGTLDHAVALAGSSSFHLAGTGNFEPLLGGRLGLHLGHFAFLSMGLENRG